MDQDLPRPDVPRVLVAGNHDLSSTLSQLYGPQRRQSSADETLINHLATSLPVRPDPLHADFVNQLTDLRDTYVKTRSNLEDLEQHLLKARAIRLARTPAAPPGPPQAPSVDVLRQNKLLTALDSSTLRKYQLLVPEDFCTEPPKPTERAPSKKSATDARHESRPVTGGNSLARLGTILPQLRQVSPSARPVPPGDVAAHVVRAEPASLHLDSFQVNRSYELSLRVKNVSCSLLWLRLVPPATPHFQLKSITFPGAQSTLAPGLSLEARITFLARRRCTYRDRVLVMTPLGELAVPLLASHQPPVLCMDASIELGEALVGCRKRHLVTVTNEGGHGQFCVLLRTAWPGAPPELSDGEPDVDGASFAVRPDRFTLDTGESIKLDASYLPAAAGAHRETLTLVCDNAQARHVTVRGCGVRGATRLVAACGDFHGPTVGQYADKYCDSFLRLPDTLPRLEVGRTIRLKNTSGVTLTYRWEQRPAVLDVYGQDVVDVAAGSDTRVTPTRGTLHPFQEVSVTFSCCTRRLGERRVVWSLLLENMLETGLNADDLRFEPGWPRPGLLSRLERRQSPRRTASTSCLLRPPPLDLHAPQQRRPVRSGSLPPAGRPPMWDALACEVQTLCRCEPLRLWLEPPFLRLLDPVPLWSRVTRPVTIVNDSDYAAPFEWETVRRGDLLVSVRPASGSVLARGRLPLTVTLWSARELQLSSELRCVSRQFHRSVCLPVVASFLGPVLHLSAHRLELPRTRVGGRSERQLVLTNPTKLPLEWRTSRVVERSATQSAEGCWCFHDQVDPFTVSPAAGLLRAGEQAQVTVAFEPPAPAAYDMVLGVSVDGSSQSSAVSVGAEAYLLSLAVAPAFHKLDAYVGGAVSLMVFVSNTCDQDVPFHWEVPPSDSVQVAIEPAESVLMPWATLVSQLRVTGLRPGPYDHYSIPCCLDDRSYSAHLTLYGEVMMLSASVHIAPSWGRRPAGVPDLGDSREVLGRSRRRELERQEREAQEQAARQAQPPPEPERPPTPPPSPKTKKDKKRATKSGKKGKKKGGKGVELKPQPEPEPEPQPEPELKPEPEPPPPPEQTVDELVAEWELVDPGEVDCGPLVLLFGHDVDIHTVVVQEFHVRNDTPIGMQCGARVLNFPGHRQERCVGEPPMAVEVRRISDQEREDVWSGLLSDGRGLALLVRPAQFSVPAHSQTLVRVFCCANMWGWYQDQLVVSGDGIPDLLVDVRVGVTGSPILVANTGSNHVRFGCQLYGTPPVERHLCLNNVSPCPIQLNMAVALESPVESHPPPFSAYVSLGADFEPLLPLWDWRVNSDELKLGLRPVFGHEQQAYYTVTPEVVVVPARAKVWVLLQLHPVCLPPAGSHWEWTRRQQPVDVLAWLTAHTSLRPQDRAPPGGLVTRADGYNRRPLRVQLRAQLRSAYLAVTYPEPAAVGLEPPPVLAGPEQAARLVAPVTALVDVPHRSAARLQSHITLHNRHQVDVEVLCWTTLPFALVRASSQRGAVERPDRCTVPRSGHTRLTVEFVSSRALLRFCLTERLTRPQRVRFSPAGEAELLSRPDSSESGDDCLSAEDKREDGDEVRPTLLTDSERAVSVAGSEDGGVGGCVRRYSEPDLSAAKLARPVGSLQQLLLARSAQMAAERRAAAYCLREVEVVHQTTESGAECVRFSSKLVLQYMDSHVQAFPVECTLALPALRVSSSDVQFGQVTIGDVARRGFYISNPTIGGLSWSARLVPRLPSPQTSATSRLWRRRSTRLVPRPPDGATFRLTPEFGVLAPRGRQHVVVTFSPASYALYSASVELTGPCLLQPVCLLVSGEGTHDELPHMPGT